MTPTCRPRVEGDREDEILDACVELLIEMGYDRLTMDAVARRAKASKATLYRRWESKPSLVTDALVRAKDTPHPVDHDTGSLRGDLIATFCGHDGLSDTGTRVLGAVVTALSTDPEFAERFRESFIGPKLEVSRRLYERAVARGEISAAADLDVIAPALAGIMLHRTFLMGLPTDDATVERVIDSVILPAVHAASPAPATATATTTDRRRSHRQQTA